jgi:hypothetical protein
MFRRLSRGLLLVCAVLSLADSGCGSKPKPALVPVAGKVLFRDKPVGGAALEFVPDPKKSQDARTAVGKTESDGSFRLSTPPHGEGAVKGVYKVTVSSFMSKQALPEKYQRLDKTPLTIEIKEGGNEKVTLKLEP